MEPAIINMILYLESRNSTLKASHDAGIAPDTLLATVRKMHDSDELLRWTDEYFRLVDQALLCGSTGVCNETLIKSRTCYDLSHLLSLVSLPDSINSGGLAHSNFQSRLEDRFNNNCSSRYKVPYWWTEEP